MGIPIDRANCNFFRSRKESHWDLRVDSSYENFTAWHSLFHAIEIPVRIFKYIGFRRSLVFAFDLLSIGVAFWGAFLLRFDFQVPPEQAANFRMGLPWVYGIQTVVFISQGLYRGLWSFASLRDLFLIIRAAILAVAISVAVLAIGHDRLLGWPRSVFPLNGFLLILILGGGRFAYRSLREMIWKSRGTRKKILIIGAGQSANLIAREFSSRPELAAQIVGFLDDNPKLKGFQIQGKPVLGTLEKLPEVLDKYRPQEVIIAVPSLRGNRVKAILAASRERNTPCRICPPIRDVLLGKVELSQLREVLVEDLLRRDVIKVDETALDESIHGRRVMITGAGGSIGSELCRQVLKYRPAVLVLYERSEYNLYRFEQELKGQGLLETSLTVVHFVIGDVLDERRLRETLREHEPEIVLHAAAYKHVPLMEENVYEAVRNNVVGTYRLGCAAAEAGVRSLVLISTDKAVRPTSVMGATKRMAELLTHAIGQSTGLKTVAVRFGNVLDSEGSVLPLFRDQIARGGPVTVTHPEMVRYFMTIPEASLLVLQASVLGRGGEVFLLDMSEPVKILELAEELIRLSGLRPYHDIDIVFTGLRRGEKLYEELLIDGNQAQRTPHPKIMVASREMSGALPGTWESEVRSFVEHPGIPPRDQLLNWIAAWVPEYKDARQGVSLEVSEKAETDSNSQPSYVH